MGLCYGLALSQAKFQVSSIVEYLKSINHRITINGMDVVPPDNQLKPFDLFDLAYAIYVVCYRISL